MMGRRQGARNPRRMEMLPSKELVWRGIASETLVSNPEKSEKRINKVVKKLFKKFPASAD